MKKICNELGLIFQNSALLTYFGVIRLLGKRKHEKQACATYKTQISQRQDNDNINIEALKKIAELEAAYKLQQKERKRSIKAYEEAKSSLGTESLDILRDLRLKRAQAITDAENTATRLKDMRMMLYNITRSLKKKATGRDQEKAENTNTLPTLRHYACEESPSNIDIFVLEKEAFDAGKTLGYSGTDYGLRTMSTTVAMTQEKLQYQISLYNRFAALDDTELDGSMAPDTTAESPDTNDGENFIAYVATSRFNCITAAQINEKSLCNKHTRLRQKRKSKNQAVRDAEKRIGEKSIQKATAGKDVAIAHGVACESREALRSFYQSSRAKKEKRSQEIVHKKQYWKQQSRCSHVYRKSRHLRRQSNQRACSARRKEAAKAA
ncbi:hypothetical protein VTP01DRAFT_6142 [Rhizomucor pusillus]|uniref:uncharacterized protein n=1 Tax=Rhizomucor pusillus TaxID=4840 RepID=UPI003743B423